MTFFDKMVCEVIDIAFYTSGVREIIGCDLEDVHFLWGGVMWIVL